MNAANKKTGTYSILIERTMIELLTPSLITGIAFKEKEVDTENDWGLFIVYIQ